MAWKNGSLGSFLADDDPIRGRKKNRKGKALLLSLLCHLAVRCTIDTVAFGSSRFTIFCLFGEQNCAIECSIDWNEVGMLLDTDGDKDIGDTKGHKFTIQTRVAYRQRGSGDPESSMLPISPHCASLGSKRASLLRRVNWTPSENTTHTHTPL